MGGDWLKMDTFLFHARCGRRRDQPCFLVGWGDQKAVPWAAQQGFLNIQVRILNSALKDAQRKEMGKNRLGALPLGRWHFPMLTEGKGRIKLST